MYSLSILITLSLILMEIKKIYIVRCDGYMKQERVLYNETEYSLGS